MASETTPLVSAAGGSGPTAYFLDGVHKRKPSSADSSFVAALSRENEEVDSMPRGGVAAEFNPRPVGGKYLGAGGKRKMRKPSVGGGWLDYVASDSWKPRPPPSAAASSSAPNANTPSGGAAIGEGDVGTLVLPRKVPIKVEPKVHFANERTFLAWLHVVLVLAAASMTIVTYAEDSLANQMYGIVLLPVSVAFIFYSLWQCECVFLSVHFHWLLLCTRHRADQSSSHAPHLQFTWHHRPEEGADDQEPRPGAVHRRGRTDDADGDTDGVYHRAVLREAALDHVRPVKVKTRTSWGD